jgi:hypothetical protein
LRLQSLLPRHPFHSDDLELGLPLGFKMLVAYDLRGVRARLSDEALSSQSLKRAIIEVSSNLRPICDVCGTQSATDSLP